MKAGLLTSPPSCWRLPGDDAAINVATSGMMPRDVFEGSYSSGYCPGVSPDSLLIPRPLQGRKPQHAHFVGAKLINNLDSKDKNKKKCLTALFIWIGKRIHSTQHHHLTDSTGALATGSHGG